MPKFSEILYYIKLVIFIISLVVVFLLMRTIFKCGVFGYLFLFMESIYIIANVIMILMKNKRYREDIAFNIMQIGVYTYIVMIFIRSLNFNISTALNNYQFYCVNFIIMCVLIITSFAYMLVAFLDKKEKK